MQYPTTPSLRPVPPRLLALAAFLSAAPGLAFADCIDDAAAFQHVNVSLMRAIAQVESGTQTNVVNRNSNGTVDIGLMQINSSWLPRLAQVGITEQSLYDPCTNAYVAAWILAENIRQFGPTWNAIGAYNAASPEKRLAYAQKVYATAQSITRSPDSPMPILPPSYTPPAGGYNPFSNLEVTQVRMSAPRTTQSAPAALPASQAIAQGVAPGAYSFGWAVTGADDAKPVQVFDDGAKIYVQFSDMKRPPAIFADTPRGRVLLRWEAQPPYAVISSAERTLIFQIGTSEARAQKTANADAGRPALPGAQNTAAKSNKADKADKAAAPSTDALWYLNVPRQAAQVQTKAQEPARTAVQTEAQATPPAAGATWPVAQTPSLNKPSAPAKSDTNNTNTNANPGTSALWYVTK
ncbi:MULTISPECIES: transglycosylase SLT domain-containing protein [unclassified Paraburkholderia]|uniref:lytic transglycosylase domain-containing protein n=1 Tax=unclassified Paraburkholderia TaxID=2615204 RepID=UPI002AB1CB35|nr:MULTISPECIES: transglycosylase SLT domain-containing protein [unclassified Paraburkholderia]